MLEIFAMMALLNVQPVAPAITLGTAHSSVRIEREHSAHENTAMAWRSAITAAVEQAASETQARDDLRQVPAQATPSQSAGAESSHDRVAHEAFLAQRWHWYEMQSR